MSGDYSRHTFDEDKNYSGVLMQQGRVQLDADWNEQVHILDRRFRAETADIVGRCGVPATDVVAAAQATARLVFAAEGRLSGFANDGAANIDINAPGEQDGVVVQFALHPNPNAAAAAVLDEAANTLTISVGSAVASTLDQIVAAINSALATDGTNTEFAAVLSNGTGTNTLNVLADLGLTVTLDADEIDVTFLTPGPDFNQVSFHVSTVTGAGAVPIVLYHASNRTVTITVDDAGTTTLANIAAEIQNLEVVDTAVPTASASAVGSGTVDGTILNDTNSTANTGLSGGQPEGFNIEASGSTFTIGRGRIYVDGLLAENHGAGPTTFDIVLAELRGTLPLAYEAQPYFPDSTNLPTDGRLLIYLDVWQREVTFLKTGDLVEKAIGVDTTTRLQTVWQVRFLSVSADATCAISADDTEWLAATRPAAGRLSSEPATVQTTEPDPCLTPPTVGFRNLENRLYRVEIHDAGDGQAATFKWSADGAGLTTAVNAISSARTRLTVKMTRKGPTLQLQVGDWVEITDNVQELAFQPGEMRKVADVDHGTGEITLQSELPAGMFPTTGPDDETLPERYTRLRRWDQKGQIRDRNGVVIGDVDTSGGVIPMSTAGGPPIAFQLDNNVVVEFGFDTNAPQGEFRVGDYWNILTRHADGSVQRLSAAPPRGIHHHYCRLALVNIDDQQNLTVLSDCRRIFPTVTELTHFYYVSGDGQEGPTPEGQLPRPLQVAVFNGQQAVEGTAVRFRIIEGQGGQLRFASTTGTAIVVETNADGIAQCNWRLETPTPPVPACQRVEATLLDDAGQVVHHTIRFNATPTREHEPGIHVTEVLLSGDGGDGSGGPLPNDMSLTPSQLVNGLLLVCDDTIDDFSVKPATCFLTLDIPANRFDPTLDGADSTIVLDGNPGADQQGIFWRPTGQAANLLNQVISAISEPILARLTVKGNFVFGTDRPTRYLDGDTFGVLTADGSTTPNNRLATRLDLSNRSGDRHRGGDFEMWFWLVNDQF